MTLPVIGITAHYDPETRRTELSTDYSRAVEKAGGLPFIIPTLDDDPTQVETVLDHLDALLLTGGVDVNPGQFGENPHSKLGRVSPERDRLELPLTRAALARKLPILGICRGIQVLNVAAGGTLYQDLYSQLKEPFKHYQEAPRWFPSHEVAVDPATRTGSIHGVTTLQVNSFHHQAVNRVAPGFVVTARAADGVIEGIERPEDPFTVGIQWHPEGMWERDSRFLAIFAALVDAAHNLVRR